MPFIGNQPAESYASFETETFSVSATTNYTLSHAVTNENEIRLVINGVVQQPGSGKAYTASGTTLTLSSATASGDSMYAVYLGRALQTVNPPSGSVGSSQVAASIITGQTALGATPADTDELLISDAGTLKRVDFSHLKSANTPAFQAYRTSYQSISNSTDTKVQNNIELYDTDSAYDNSTNYRFTVPSGGAGKYLIGAGNTIDNVTDQKWVITRVRKNGSDLKNVIAHSSGGHPVSAELSFTDDASVGDYYESWVKHLDGSTSDLRTEYTNYFWMMKIIGA